MQNFLILYVFTFTLFIPRFELISSEKECVVDLQDSELNGKELNDCMQYLFTEKNNIGLNEIKTEEYQKEFRDVETNSFGYSNQFLWMKLHVQNKTSENVKWFIMINYPILDEVTLFNKKKSSGVKIGDHIPFNERNFDYRNPVYELVTASKENETYYLRIKSSSSLTVPILAYNQKNLVNHISNDQIVLGLYYGVLLIMFFYNLVILFSTRDKNYLFYILYILSYGLFQFSLNGLGFQYLWPNTGPRWADNSITFLITWGGFSILFFSRFFLNTRFHTPKMLVGYNIFFVVYILAMISSLFFFNYSINMKFALFLTFSGIIYVNFNAVQCARKGQRTAYFFLISWAVFTVGIILYILKAVGILPNNFITNSSVLVGSALEVTLLSLGLADKIKTLSFSLQEKVKDLNIAKHTLEKSEKKFRELFESSEDLLILLNAEFNIIDLNHSSPKYIGFKSSDMIGKYFLDFIYMKDDDDFYNKMNVEEELKSLKDNKSVHFQSEFRQKYVMEPKELIVRVQKMESEDSDYFLARISKIEEDLLSKYIEKERYLFKINNYIQNTESLSFKLTKNISRFSSAEKVAEIRTSLREMLINAIEHGNLNISFDEKTSAMMEGRYFEFLKERQQDEKYLNRTVVVEYVLNEKMVAYRITDEGEGFDHKKIMSIDISALNESGIAHGRGIMMTKVIFDIIKYNKKGNQILMIKYFD